MTDLPTGRDTLPPESATGPLWVNLGSGADRRDGWLSVDFNPHYRPDLIFDMRVLPLPFDDNSVHFCYMEMALSQFTMEHGQLLLNDIYRMMEPGGVLRVHEKNFDWVLARVKRPDPVNEWEIQASPAEMLQYWLKKYSWQFVYDGPALRKYMERAGFQVHPQSKGNSPIPELVGLERRRGGLVFEGVK